MLGNHVGLICFMWEFFVKYFTLKVVFTTVIHNTIHFRGKWFLGESLMWNMSDYVRFSRCKLILKYQLTQKRQLCSWRINRFSSNVFYWLVAFPEIIACLPYWNEKLAFSILKDEYISIHSGMCAIIYCCTATARGSVLPTRNFCSEQVRACYRC